MSCLASETIGLLVEGLLSPDEAAEAEKHLLACAQCSAIAGQFREENALLKDVLCEFRPDSNFTEQVMARIADVTMEDPQPAMAESRMQRKRGGRSRGKLAAGIVAAAVASVLAIAPYASPSFASYLSSFFTSSIWHPGIKQAAHDGFVQRVEKEAVSNGITFRVLDIFADQSRILAYYEVKDQEGRYVNPEMKIGKKGGNVNRAVLTDTQGNVLAESVGWRRDNERAVLEFPVPPGTYDQLVLSLHIQELGGKSISAGGEKASPVLNGDWRIEAPFDMKKSNNASKTVLVNKQFVSPQGVQVTLDALLLHPSSFEAKIQSQWTEEAAKRIFGSEGAHSSLRDRLQLEYRFLAEDGRLLGAYPAGMNQVRVNGKNGAGFLPINDQRRVTFVLDAIETEEPSHVRLSLDLKNRNELPLTFEADGAHFVIHSFGRENVKNQPAFVIRMSGAMPEETKYFLWTAVDDQGKEYQVGGMFNDILKDGKRYFEQTMILSGMDHLPDHLTLKATRAVKRYSGFAWEETIELK